MSDRGGVGGGFGANLARLIRAGQEVLARRDTKESKETKDSKGADAKGEVRGEGKAGGAGAAKGKGKARGADLGAIGAILGGSDTYAIEDEEERQRKRQQRFYLGDEDDANFVEQDAASEKSAVGHISAEFRAQVASGMVAGRSFTQGSCLVPDNVEPEEEEVEVKSRGKRRKKS
jgi:hypothetical protein